MLWSHPPCGDCIGARQRTPAPGRRRCVAAGLRPRPGGERAPPLYRAALRRPLGREGKMAGRQRLRAGPGPREGKQAHLVEGAAPASSLGGPSDSSCGAGAGGARFAESAGPRCGG